MGGRSKVTEEQFGIPWKTFGPELDNLLEATANKLDREWPNDRHPGARVILRPSLPT